MVQAMQVLAVTPEIFPLIKTGGLADVTGALPLALAGHGVAVRTLMPGYPQVMGKFRKKKQLLQYPSLQGGMASVLAAEVAGLDLLVLDAPHLFDRPGGPYGDLGGADWPDNWRRFAALCQVGADIAAGAVRGWQPEIVHAHDWQAAMTLAYMRFGGAVGIPTVMTVHNLAFQGQFGASIFGELGLPASAMALDGVEYYGGVGYPQGRSAGRLGDHHGQPDLCAGDPHAGIRDGPRRVGRPCARPIWSASSTVSTPTSGIRPTTRCLPPITRRSR